MRALLGLMSAAAAMMVALVVSLQPAYAERRVAMVVGIDRYPSLGDSAQLQRAVADANGVGDTLRKLGFDVTTLSTGHEVTQDYFLKQFGMFLRSIQPGDVAVFYFAGHGVGFNSSNYLVPADMPDFNDADDYLFRAHALAEADIRARMLSRGPRVVLLMLDACRNNPFRSTDRALALSRGLQPMESSKGVLTIYAAGYGQAALDRLSDVGDDNPNSVFTRVVIGELNQPGLNLVDFSEDIREKVAALARGAGFDQVPAVDNQLIGGRSVYLGSAPQPLPPPVPSAPAPPPPPASGALSPDEIAWSYIQASSDIAVFRRFLAQFPDSRRRREVEARIARLEQATPKDARTPVQTDAPLGTQTAEAEAWNQAASSAFPAEIRAFLDRFPETTHRAQAEQRLGEIESRVWNGTAADDVAALRHYAATFPNGAHIAPAQARIAMLESRQHQIDMDDELWRRTDGADAEAQRDYLRNFPKGRHAGEAAVRLSSLEPPLPHDRRTPATPPARQSRESTPASLQPPKATPARHPGTADRERRLPSHVRPFEVQPEGPPRTAMVRPRPPAGEIAGGGHSQRARAGSSAGGCFDAGGVHYCP